MSKAKSLLVTSLLLLSSIGSANAAEYGQNWGMEALPGITPPSPNSSQLAGYAKADTTDKIQGLIDANIGAIYCGGVVKEDVCFDNTIRAYESACISPSMWSLFRNNRYRAIDGSGTYLYYPECTRDEVFTAPCKCGCVIEGTQVLAWINDAEKWERIEKLAGLKAFLLSLVSPFDGLNDFERIPAKAQYISGSNGGLARPVITVQARLLNDDTSENYALTVTPGHPFLLSDGEFRAASDLQATDILMDFEGRELHIVGLVPGEYTGAVYNAELSNESHVIFAEKFAVGDLAMQGIVEQEKARLSLRKNSK
ncbi:MAG: hypothetical protein EOP04_03885 [Proteobacteria bacterium]|nr:MAG: hypothetical protein EOP04_03885 [Pseudomonadota bacterium]